MTLDNLKPIKLNMTRLFGYILLLPIIFCGYLFAADLHTSYSLDNSNNGVNLLGSSTDAIELKFDIGSIDFYNIHTKDGDYILPTVQGFSRSFQIGEPSLPVINRIISIPFGCSLQLEVTDTVYESFNLKSLDITVPIFPVQPSLSKADEPALVQFEKDETLYKQDATYKLPLVQSEIPGVLRSQRLAKISFSPFEYNPVTQEIRVCKSATVKVNYVNPDWATTKAISQKYRSPYFESSYDKIINYLLSTDAIENDITVYPVKYLIIADRMFEAQLAPFIEWKTKKGFDVVVAYTDEIGYTANSIRSYIQNLYQSGTVEDPAPSFVLLVGDVEQIPAFDGQEGTLYTDLYYGEFTGDYLPDIYYGRFSAQSTAELQPQIDKTLEYEQYLMPDPSYLGNVTLVSGVDASYAPTYGNGQINYGSTNYFNAAHGIDPNIWLYPASNGTGVENVIIQTINDGVGFYNYTAHCNHLGHFDPPFEVDDVANLTNIHKYLLGIANCCQPNTFGDNFATPCFGEVFLRAENKGGIGYIGASEDTYWDEDYWWTVGYGPIVGSGAAYEDTGPGAFDGIFHDHGEPVMQHYNTNAAIIMAGNLAVLESGSTWSNHYWEVYHLMGDPSVMTYFGVPSANTVTLPDAADMYTSAIEITADPGSYVGISFDGVLHGAGYVTETGTVSIVPDHFPSTGTADVVITGQNKIPYFGTITIVETVAPYIVYQSYVVDDGLTGNNNGLADAGEPVLLGLQLQNLGLTDGDNVEAVLSSDDPNITITDNTESYGTVPGGNGTVNIDDAFAIQFDASTPDLYAASFNLTVTGTAGTRLDSPWQSQFEITAHSPSLDIITMAIDDAAGNGDGLLDPGETVDIILTVANSGSGAAGQVVGEMSTTDGYFSIPDFYGYFGDIASTSQADNEGDRFTITINPTCYPGYTTNFDLSLTGEFGLQANITLNMLVGGRVEIYADDFSTNKGWTGLGGPGEWTIGPATGGNGSDTYGLPDPSEDHTASTSDNYLLGNDLNPGTSGDYRPNLTETDWATSPTVNCASYDETQLSFYRCLGVEGNSKDFASFEVFDGLSWVRLFESSATMDESSWNYNLYDVSPYADGNQYFRFRFGLGATNGYANYCGWNIDDIQLVGYYRGGSCGDFDGDGIINIIDIVFLINYKYKGGTAPEPLSSADINGDTEINVLDVVHLINYKYKGGAALNCP